MTTKTVIKGNARNILLSIYEDWLNDYLTIDRFAEHNGLTLTEAQTLIDLARAVAAYSYPDE